LGRFSDRFGAVDAVHVFGWRAQQRFDALGVCVQAAGEAARVGDGFVERAQHGCVTERERPG
jgi:hypothetical protein